MNRGATIAAAFAIDMLAGDPAWLPHPVRAVGATIAFGEVVARRLAGSGPIRERRAGTILASTVVALTATSAAAFVTTIGRLAGNRGVAVGEAFLAASTLATRDLLAEADAVLDALEAGDLERARRRVARIVGRDTAHLDRSGIVRATIETLAESACDGIVAPLCALVAGGVPLAFAFKAASTLDSTIGHIEAPYTDFGRTAAMLDDALCFVPARLCALAICLLAPFVGGSTENAWRTLLADGALHASPNAGRPEAAMAGALGVRLGGTNRYDGVEHRGAVLGARFAQPDVSDGRRARTLVLAVACFTAFCCALVPAAIDGP